MDRDLIKALLNKAVVAGSWELERDTAGMCNILIRLTIQEDELQKLNQENGKKLAEFFKGNGSRRFDWK